MKDNSESIDIKEKVDETKAIEDLYSHPSPDKNISPDKLALKLTHEDIEPEFSSKIHIEPVADIEAQVPDNTAHEQQNEIVLNEQKRVRREQRKETVKQNLDKLGFSIKGPKMFKRDKSRKKQFDVQEALEMVKKKNQFKIQNNDLPDE